MAELQVGSTFAGHRIEGIAGRGGMGVVYRATHLALDHVVAMKVISAQLAGDEVFRERFRSESRIAVSIRHPNVVPIHHAGEEDGLIFVTMDLIEGTDLRKLLNVEGKLAPERAIDLISQAAAALDAAHSKGLVHRDVKPGNILIETRESGEHAYLTDFGLTKRIEATSGVTATGAFVGTLDYVAPEQIKGQRTDARTDVYALGCVLYELLTGQPPFASQEDKVAKIYAHLQEDAPPLLAKGRGLPEGLDGVVSRALAKEPEDRYPSAGDLARAARAALDSRPVTVAEHTVGVGAAAPDSEELPGLGETQPAEAQLTAATALGEWTSAAGSAAADSKASDGGQADAAPGGEAAGAEGGVSVRSAETVAAPSPKESRLSRLPGIPALVLAAATVAVAAVVITGVGSGGDSTTASSTTGSTTAGNSDQPPPLGQFVKTTAITGGDAGVSLPVEVADGLGYVWVTNRLDAGTVTKVDANLGTELTTIPVGALPEGIAIGPHLVWIANAGDDTVQSINPDNDRSKFTGVAVGNEPRAIAYGDNFFWVANSGDDTISKVDPRKGLEVATFPTGSEPHGLLVRDGSIYVVNRTDQSVWKLDEKTGKKLDEQTVGENPKGVAYANGKIWVTNTGPDDGSGPGTVSVLDAKTLDPVKEVDLGDGSLPRGIVFDSGSIWVALGADGSVAQVDPSTFDVRNVKQKGVNEADGITGGPGGIWTANGDQQTIARINPTPPGNVK